MNNKWKVLITGLLGCFIPILLYKTVVKVIVKGIANEFVKDFVAELLFAIFALIAVIILKKMDIYRRNPEGLKKGWMSALVLYALMAFYLFFGLINIFTLQVTVIDVLCFIGQMILVGFCEETLFRGILQNTFHEIFGEDSQLHVILAVICCGVMFGLTHLTNMFTPGVSVAGAVAQAAITSLMGIYFCAIYYRTGKNLWFLIFLHSLYDAIASFFGGRLSGASSGSVINGGEGMPLQGVLFFAAIYLSASLFILRKSKIQPMLHNQI